MPVTVCPRTGSVCAAMSLTITIGQRLEFAERGGARQHMGAIQAIFLRHGPTYRAAFADDMPAAQRRVMDAISDCRSAACGSILYQCADCGEPRVVARCCGNRHCPVCQHGNDAFRWPTELRHRRQPSFRLATLRSQRKITVLLPPTNDPKF